MNFKDQVERDLTAVFHNSREHADVVEFWIDGIDVYKRQTLNRASVGGSGIGRGRR